MGKLIIEKGIDNKNSLVQDYISASERQREIELEFCKRNFSCVECGLFNYCVTASISSNGIRK